MSTVLVTGGAGFVGSHLTDALLARGHLVRVLDALDPQVHGEQVARPMHLDRRAELLRGDLRDADLVKRALAGVDVIFHQAALVGVGQSMYEIRRYVEGNSAATGVLLDVLVNSRHRVKRLVVASSMSIYGEGAYDCPTCGRVAPGLRPEEQLRAHEWEVRCPSCGSATQAAPTPESKPLIPTSVYAITKRDHEELCLVVGRAYNIPTIALRYFNVYGPRQALSNPYTGVMAIFSARLLNGNPPLVYEDGLQTRDFVNVRDIVRANLLAMEAPPAVEGAFNIGTGRATSVRQIAEVLAERLGVAIAPEVTERFRAGDIRHCVADISLAQRALGYAPSVTLEAGMDELVAWVRGQQVDDRVEQAASELERRGLVSQ